MCFSAVTTVPSYWVRHVICQDAADKTSTTAESQSLIFLVLIFLTIVLVFLYMFIEIKF